VTFWNPVGSSVQSQYSNPTVSPTTIGNILVVVVSQVWGAYSADITLSGGGVSVWQGSVDFARETTAGGGSGCYIAWGVITTTGSQTLTCVMSGSPNAGVIVQEFSPPTGTIVEDINQAGATGPGVASGNYPSITPTAGSNNLYIAAGWLPNFPGGSSAGFTYVIQNYYTEMVYQCNVSGACSPAYTCGGTGNFATYALFLTVTAPATMKIVMLL